ncbi:hypothetical protein DN562_31075, partial [Burkholderia multivorans]
DQQRAADVGFRVGQQVFHTKFGEGTVTALEGSGAGCDVEARHSTACSFATASASHFSPCRLNFTCAFASAP